MQSWSFSRRETYVKCPFRAKLQYDDRVEIPPDPKLEEASLRGTRMHDSAQGYVARKQEEFDSSLNSFANELGNLRELHDQGLVLIEDEWAWTKDFEAPCDWKDNALVWVRMKLDFLVKLGPRHYLVIDLKTGKKDGNQIKHTEQGQLYAVGTWLKFAGEVDQVDVEFWYSDQDDTLKNSYTDEQVQTLLGTWLKHGNDVTSGHYPPRPNIFSCKYCPYRQQSDGGTGACEHAVKIIKVGRKKTPGFFNFG